MIMVHVFLDKHFRRSFVALFFFVVLLGPVPTMAMAQIQIKPQCKIEPPLHVFMQKLPIYDHAWQAVNNCDKYPPHDVALAMVIFYHSWVEEFGDSSGLLEERLNRLYIEWGKTTKTLSYVYTVQGIKRDSATVLGLTLAPTHIWVYQREKGDSLSQTSLVHELVHVALWATNPNSHGDADHEGNKIPGWTPAHTVLITKINHLLSAFDL